MNKKGRYWNRKAQRRENCASMTANVLRAEDTCSDESFVRILQKAEMRTSSDISRNTLPCVLVFKYDASEYSSCDRD